MPGSGAQPRLVILCGVPFAGKSTLARALAARPGWVLLEVDAINRDRGAGSRDGRLSRAEWTATYREAFRRLDGLLAEGRSVVYDATNGRRRMRDRLRQIAAVRGARAVVVLVEPPLVEVRRRRETNRLTPRRPDVHDDDFAEVVSGFQAPGEDEGAVRYDGSTPVAEWIAARVAAGFPS